MAGDLELDSTDETVNHPKHYNQGIEAIEIIESWNLDFNAGNVIKYLLRAPHKGNTLDDLKKALWYLNRVIENYERANQNRA